MEITVAHRFSLSCVTPLDQNHQKTMHNALSYHTLKLRPQCTSASPPRTPSHCFLCAHLCLHGPRRCCQSQCRHDYTPRDPLGRSRWIPWWFGPPFHDQWRTSRIGCKYNSTDKPRVDDGGQGRIPRWHDSSLDAKWWSLKILSPGLTCFLLQDCTSYWTSRSSWLKRHACNNFRKIKTEKSILFVLCSL